MDIFWIINSWLANASKEAEENRKKAEWWYIQPLVVWKKIETEELLEKPYFLDYLEIDPFSEEIHIFPDRFESRKEMIEFFNIFFQEFYIENIDYETFQNIIYDFDAIKEKWIKIKLGKFIRKFDKFRREQYDKFMVTQNKEWWIVNCVFNRIYIQVWKEEKIFDYRMDEFLAYIFCKWIRFWYNESQIQKWIYANYHNAIIASRKKAEKWSDATLKLNETPVQLYEIVEEAENDLSYPEAKHIRRYKSFPQIDISQNWWLLLIKKKATKWKHWMEFDWTLLIWEFWKDKHPVNVLCWEWIYYEEDENQFYIKAEKSGFINVEDEYWINVKYPRKISIREYQEHNKDVDNESWIIIVDEWDLLIQRWNIAKNYWIIWNAVRVERWEIDWFVYSRQWNIKTFWSVYWWKLFARKWDIHVEQKIIMWSKIEAYEWNIYARYAEFSIIIWKKVQLDHAEWCIIFCEELILWKSNANNVIFLKKIETLQPIEARMIQSWDFKTNSKNTNIILLARKKIVWDTKMIQKLKKAIHYYKTLENKNEWIEALIRELEMKIEDYESNSVEWVEEIKKDLEVQIKWKENVWNINFFVWDFFNEVALSDIWNMKDIDRENYLRILFELFNNNMSLWSILLSRINLFNQVDSTWAINLNYTKLRIELQEDLEDKTTNKIVEVYEWNNRRAEWRMQLLDIDEFEQMIIKQNWTKLDHARIDIKVDWIIAAIKDLSCNWMALYIRKNDLWENHILYNKWWIIDAIEFLTSEWEKLVMKAMIKNRLPQTEDEIINWNNKDTIILSCEFVETRGWEIHKINRWTQDRIFRFINSLQRQLLKRNDY